VSVAIHAGERVVGEAFTVDARRHGEAGLRIPVHGVCTLDVIAAAAAAGGEFLVATDARRKEVYWAQYDADRRRLEGPLVSGASSIPEAPGLAADPLYLRRPDAREPGPPKRVTPS
jgi:tRNA threonylcarbamoyladenosine biosynthesis protein TsaB